MARLEPVSGVVEIELVVEDAHPQEQLALRVPESPLSEAGGLLDDDFEFSVFVGHEQFPYWMGESKEYGAAAWFAILSEGDIHFCARSATAPAARIRALSGQSAPRVAGRSATPLAGAPWPATPHLMKTDLPQAPLAGRSHWVFDLDGTLTVAAHDFDAIRSEFGVQPGKPLLETLATLPADEAERANRRLAEIELEIAADAVAQEGAGELLAHLRDGGRNIGILTRNTAPAARETLAAAGLMRYFDDGTIVARETCVPKPSPAGVHHLLGHWRAPAAAAIVVGDYLYDLQAGRAAEATTVHLDVTGLFPWPQFADYAVNHLRQLLVLAGG